MLEFVYKEAQNNKTEIKVCNFSEATSLSSGTCVNIAEAILLYLQLNCLKNF